MQRTHLALIAALVSAPGHAQMPKSLSAADICINEALPPIAEKKFFRGELEGQIGEEFMTLARACAVTVTRNAEGKFEFKPLVLNFKPR